MSDLTLILLAAGSSQRFELDVKKQWLRVGSKPLWLYVAKSMESMELFSKIIVTASSEDIVFMQNYSKDFTFVEGSSSRQRSLANALAHVTTSHVVVSDIARACMEREFLLRIISKKDEADVIVPCIKVQDTVVYGNETIDRDQVKLIQTPQLSRVSKLKEALRTELEYTDESSAILACGGSRLFLEGRADAQKITHVGDLKKLPCLQPPEKITLSGNGFDVHAFEEAKEMFLCGVKIDVPYGFKAHSDGDVAIHSLIDALLGAAGMGDIGMLFPDTDEAYKGADSTLLLARVVQLLKAHGFEIVNVDITIIAQKPKLMLYKEKMREKIANILGIAMFFVNIKATTTENLGFIGRNEGVAVSSSANLKYFDWVNV